MDAIVTEPDEITHFPGIESTETILENVEVDEDYANEIISVRGDLHIKITNEGIVLDFVIDGKVYRSAWLTTTDLLELTH